VDNRRECFETAGDSDIEDSQKILKMTQEEFLLKWNDHHASFFTIVEDLCRTEQLCDVTLACGGQVFETHKLILSVCSPYFRTLLNSRPDKHPIVYLKDVNPKHLEQLLSYMYRGEINVLQEDLGPLIETARGLQIKGLADAGNSDNSSNSKPKPTHNGLPSHPLPQLTQPKRPRTTTPTSIPKMARIEAPRLPQVPLPGLSPSNLHDEGGESIVEVDPTQGAVKQEMWMMGSGGDSNDGEENDGMESNIPHESYEQDMQAEDEQYIHAGSEGLTGQQFPQKQLHLNAIGNRNVSYKQQSFVTAYYDVLTRGLTITKAAMKHQIPRKTLEYYVKGKATHDSYQKMGLPLPHAIHEDIQQTFVETF